MSDGIEGDQCDGSGDAVCANIRRLDGTLFRAHVTDLCPSGCRLKAGIRLEVGETIRLMVPGLTARHARVRWTAREITALSFRL